MSVKQVDIGSAAGIDEAIRFLKRTMSKKALQKTANGIAKTLLNEAKVEAENVYGDAPVTVSKPQKTEEGYSLVASGPEVAFIEFGIGWGVDAKNEFAKSAHGAPNVSVGSWSKDTEGPFYRSNLRGWHYAGEYITGAETELLPRKGMEAARLYVTDERNVEEATRKVISDD